MTKRGKCRVCGQELSITAQGGVRVHGYARGAGETEVNCPGSGQKPLLDLDQEIVCLYCNGLVGVRQDCKHCNATGKLPLREVSDYDALTVIENAIGDVDTEQAAEMLRSLMKFGFIRDPEEAPNPDGTGWVGVTTRATTGATEEDALLLAALLRFWHEWEKTAKGPVKPQLQQLRPIVDEAIANWNESKKVANDGK